MANRHYAEIGDVWKHLPLAEILTLESPLRYWESHAGSARYDLTPSLGRDYGARYFVTQASSVPRLDTSAYGRILTQLKGQERQLSVYPGSPYIALTSSQVREYLFCDLDGASLETIREAARALGVPKERVTCVQDDGVGTLRAAAAQLSDQEARETLAHIDPYHPFEATSSGWTSLDLFGDLSWRGVRAVLWYGYDRSAARTFVWERIRSAIAAHQLGVHALWCGEINLVALQDPDFTLNPGVRGCGILTSNLQRRTVFACVGLGRALAEAYRTATFPDGSSGALVFSVVTLERGESR